MNTRLAAASSHDTYGLTLSLWRDCFLQAKKGPEGYGQAYMEDVLARIDALLAEADDAPAETAAERPNIIMVLSESFYDLTRLPDLQYERDPLENFHALKSEGISGTFHSHYLGYGTGYLEMSMLYGITGLDFGAGTNICFLEDDAYEKFDALPEQYTKGGGYRAEMLHGYNDSLYNRTVTYPMLGFSELLFSADIQKLGIDDTVYGGYYMRDGYLFQGVLDRMEAINDGGQRAFLYAITMENHQPFDPEKFNYECQIGVTSDTLSDEDMAIVRVMLEGITRADQALGALTDALRESDEPTIVVFFGDHRPNLFMTDGDTVYTKLGLCPANDTVDWTAEQINDLYATDYLIWANDAALLQGQAGTRAGEQHHRHRPPAAGADGPARLPVLGAFGESEPGVPHQHGAVLCGRRGRSQHQRGDGGPVRRGPGAAVPPGRRALRRHVRPAVHHGGHERARPVKDRKAKERTESAAGFCPRRSVLHKNGRAVENRSGPSGQRSASRSSLQARSSSFAGRP